MKIHDAYVLVIQDHLLCAGSIFTESRAFAIANATIEIQRIRINSFVLISVVLDYGSAVNGVLRRRRKRHRTNSVADRNEFSRAPFCDATGLRLTPRELKGRQLRTGSSPAQQTLTAHRRRG